MDWLWQGIVITVTGGLVLAGVITFIKFTHNKAKQANEQLPPEEVKSIEDKIESIRLRGYNSASAFYREFDNGTWMKKAPELYQISKRDLKALKVKWVQDADFTRSWDWTNIELMRLQIVQKYLTKKDLMKIIDKPTIDNYGNSQDAGRVDFVKSIQAKYPRKISKYVAQWIESSDEVSKE